MQAQAAQQGVIQFTNGTGSAISSGDVVDLGSRIGIALVDIAAAAIGSVAIWGIYTLPKDASTITQQEVYYSVSGEEISTTQAASDPRAGIAVKASATGDSYVDVQINAPRVVGDTTVDSGAGDAAGNQTAIAALIVELTEAGIIKKR